MPSNEGLMRHTTVFRYLPGLVLLIVLMAAVLAAPAGGSLYADVAAPHGIWAGAGDSDSDFVVIAIDPGPVGTQHGFFVEKMVGGCGGTPGVLIGPAVRNGRMVTITGALRCADDGSVLVPQIALQWTYNAVADKMVSADPGYPGPFTRKCYPGKATITGGSGPDTLTGGPGDDVIDGRGGDDLIQGGDGLNILCGGSGRDRIEGGNGIDVVAGGPRKDVILTERGADGVLGWGGNDRIYLQEGHDSAAGGPGDELGTTGIVGGQDDDFISGGGGRDFLRGGQDDDTMVSNGGGDIFHPGHDVHENDACGVSFLGPLGPCPRN